MMKTPDQINSNIYSFVAAKIKDLRSERQLSQNEFSKHVNLSRVSIANIELGNQKPTLELVWKISTAFAIGIDRFFPTEFDQLKNKGKMNTLNFLNELQ
ncbi:MAG: helix-turn-helix transcriptional regulator [Cyclobacteriaceae bacterium]